MRTACFVFLISWTSVISIAQESIGLSGKSESKRVYPPEMTDCREVTYKTVGDTRLNLYIFNPISPKGSPAVVFFFGGGWQNGTPQQFEFQCRELAKRGMVAITADYRVGSRHGVKPTACISDARSAVRWIRSNAQELGVDPNRIAAAGGSAGGHIAACTAFIDSFDERTEDKQVSAAPNALVLFNPVLVLASIDEFDPQGFGTRLPKERLGAEPKRMSPAHQVKKEAPPTIIFHGTQDKTVPVESAEAFVKIMKSFGNRCELKHYSGQGHGFFNKEPFKQETLDQVDEFLVSLGWLPARHR